MKIKVIDLTNFKQLYTAALRKLNELSDDDLRAFVGESLNKQFKGSNNLEEFVKEKAMQFTVTLERRYVEYVSDQFIVAFLTDKFMAQVWKWEYISMMTAAYNAGCDLFEHLLEHGCQAGGNGHHVAQSFASKFENHEYLGA
jgi:hypothetical protein